MSTLNIWFRGEIRKILHGYPSCLELWFLWFHCLWICLLYYWRAPQATQRLSIIRTQQSTPNGKNKMARMIPIAVKLSSNGPLWNIENFITKTCLYNFDPLKPHLYIDKLGFIGVNIIFLISAQNIDCGYSLEPPRYRLWVLVRTASLRRF